MATKQQLQLSEGMPLLSEYWQTEGITNKENVKIHSVLTNVPSHEFAGKQEQIIKIGMSFNSITEALRYNKALTYSYTKAEERGAWGYWTLENSKGQKSYLTIFCIPRDPNSEFGKRIAGILQATKANK